MGRKIIKDDIKFNFCCLIKQKTRTLHDKNTSYDHVDSEHTLEKYCKRIHFIPLTIGNDYNKNRIKIAFANKKYEVEI